MVGHYVGWGLEHRVCEDGLQDQHGEGKAEGKETLLLPDGSMSRRWSKAFFRDAARGNRNKMECGKFRVNARKKYFPVRKIRHWSRCPRWLRNQSHSMAVVKT